MVNQVCTHGNKVEFGRVKVPSYGKLKFVKSYGKIQSGVDEHRTDKLFLPRSPPGIGTSLQTLFCRVNNVTSVCPSLKVPRSN